MAGELKLETVLERAKDATRLARETEDLDIQREISNVAVAWIRIAEKMTGEAIEAAFSEAAANAR